MSLLNPSFLAHIQIPPNRKSLYFSLRTLLYIGFLTIVLAIGYSFLFPSHYSTFDFRNPDAVKNTLLDPRDTQGVPRRTGVLDVDSALTINSGALGVFSDATISVRLKKGSALPRNLSLTVQKGYREIFLPEGNPAEFKAFEREKDSRLFRVEGNTYQLFDDKFYRFVSDNAVRSHYTESDIIEQTSEFLSSFPIATEWIGFRSGTLLSNATGVFVVYGENEIRPIGSAEIFQAIGYDWDDVIPASEEEISLYKRGKIIQTGSLRAPETLFRVIETGSYFILDSENLRRPITDLSLLQFFLERTHAIPVSEKSRILSSVCILTPGIIFSNEYSCDLSTLSLQDISGNDYQFSLATENTIDIGSIDVTLKRSLEKGSMRYALSQMKKRLLDRYSSQ